MNVPPFFMGKYPVTQAQWKAIASLPKINRDLAPDPSRFKGDQRPVECVSWYDAMEFCQRLSKHTGHAYRLPSEAEWEYACRAGTTTPFYFGETITSELVNYDGNYTYADEPKGQYRSETTPVGQFPPNAFGLYDLHGNVWEWCLDEYHDNYEGGPKDGKAWFNDKDSQQAVNKVNANAISMLCYDLDTIILNRNNSQLFVIRGGSWYESPGSCRSAVRNHLRLGYSGGSHVRVDFRVVCVACRT